MKPFPRTKEEIKEWLLTELTPKRREDRHITDEDLENILRCLCDLAEWYWTGNDILGHFLTYVVKNDFVNATCNADDHNIKVLDVFARFCYNRLPDDWRQKGRALVG